jgi:hypothetical protein
MKHLRFLTAATVVALLAGSGLAQAQRKIMFDVPFPFMAGDQAMQPGKYGVEKGKTGGITIRDTGGKSGAVLVPLTSLGSPVDPKATALIFDEVGGKMALSEVWLGEGTAGWLVLASKADHQHRAVREMQ